MKSDRLLALEALISLRLENGSLSTHLSEISLKHPDANLPLIREYTYGVCRWMPKLSFMASQLLEKPLRKKDQDVHTLLLLGIYQLFYMRTPDHAAINESVALTRKLKKEWASKLVNGVLRNALRRKESIELEAEKTPSALFAHPDWLITRIRNDWPDLADSILCHNNIQAPMTLRVNRLKTDRSIMLEQLSAANIDAQPGSQSQTAVLLDTPIDVLAIPGFSEGLVSVQDEASQLAATFLTAEPGERVLDACAAPGGKTCAILESQPGLIEMVALDNSEKRLKRVKENLQRLGLEARIICADVLDTDAWWNGEPLDAILLDAPCSGSGVIRRHPDIKLLRNDEDIDELVKLQQQMLSTLWQCLKPGGKLLYSTCSVIKSENSDQVSAFLNSINDGNNIPLFHEAAHPCEIGLQFLPGPEKMDGFFYALLEKTESP